MSYVLGFFAADGNMIRNRRGAHFIAFYSCDKSILLAVRSTLGSTHKLGIRRRSPPWRTAYQLQIGSKEIFNDLIKLGFVPAKSKKLLFPKVPRKYLGDFVRGYFDGDGNIYFKKHYVKDRSKQKWIFTSRFTSGSRIFLESLLNILRSCGVQGGFIVGKSNHSGFELVFSHRDSVALFHLMYDTISDNGLCLARKYSLFRRAIKTLYGGVAQPGGAIPCHGRGCGFKSRRSRPLLTSRSDRRPRLSLAQ